MESSEYTQVSDEFVERLRSVLQFLQENGFTAAANAVLAELDGKQSLDTEERDTSAVSAPPYAEDYADQSFPAEEYRSRSAEPVLVSSRAASEEAEERLESPGTEQWPSGEAPPLTTRLSGSSRLYEDPDVDEYDGMDDVGYIRRAVSHQQDFILKQLDLLHQGGAGECGGEPFFQHQAAAAAAAAQAYAGAGSSPRSDSRSGSSGGESSTSGASSSASLSSPGMGSCKRHHRSSASLPLDHSQQPDQHLQPRQQPLLRAATAPSVPTGDAAWDSGPAGIVFAEPVTTPTKDGRHSSASDARPSLSRVESLSNSFIDELESGDGGAADTPPRLSEAGSAAPGDLGTPPRGSSAAGGEPAGRQQQQEQQEQEPQKQWRPGYDDVVDLSPPSPPPDCATDAGIDLSNIFELGLRACSRTSSVDVVGSSVRCLSETDSDAGGGEGRPGSRQSLGGAWPAPGVFGQGRARAPSKLAQVAPAEQQQQQEPEPAQPAPKQEQQPDGGAQVELQQELGQQQPLLELQPEQQKRQQQQQLEKQAEKQQQEQQQQEQQHKSSDSGASSSTAPPESPETPATAAGGAGAGGALCGGGGGGAFGFSFPTTPPSAADAAVHEERAERVFSTWASSHSRSGAECSTDGEDVRPGAPFALASVGSSSSAGAPAAEEAAGGPARGPWEFPAAQPAAAAPARSSSGGAAAAAAPAAPAGGEGEGEGAAAAAAAAAAPAPPSSPFSPAAAAALGGDSPKAGGGSGAGSRAASSSLGRRAAVAGASGGSARLRPADSAGAGLPRPPSSAAAAAAAGRASGGAAQRQQQQQGSAARSGTGCSVRSAQTEGAASSAARGASGAGPFGIGGGSRRSGSQQAPDAELASAGAGGYGSGELPGPRYVVDEGGNLLYEYDEAYVEARYEVFDLRVIHRRRRTGFEDSKEFPIRKNDLIAGRYQVMDFLGSAAFSQAVQALDTATGALVCLKIIKNNKDYFDQSLDEIKLLRYVNAADPDDEHHVVRLYDFFYYKEHLFLVCELLRANLYEFQKYTRDNGEPPYFTPPRIQRIAAQVLRSLAFLHSLGLVHSDLKPENILIKSYSRCEVKVIDLGSSCFVTDHLSSYVQSRSYRAPEVILGLGYGAKVDLWSLGCILAELATGYVLFQNDSLATLLVRLEGILGPLPEWMVAGGRYAGRYYTRERRVYERSKATGRYELLVPKRTSLRHRVPGADPLFLDFLSCLLTPDPNARPSAEDALGHPWLSHPYPPAEQVPD